MNIHSRALLVHLFTATGAIFAMLAMLAAADDRKLRADHNQRRERRSTTLPWAGVRGHGAHGRGVEGASSAASTGKQKHDPC